MIQIQQNGLSPRASKGHRRTRSATNKEELCGGGAGAKASTTPTPSAQLGRFFHDPAPASASILPTVGSKSSAPSPASCKGHPKQQSMRQSTTVRLVAMLATALAALLCTRATFASPASGTTSLRPAAAAAAAAAESPKDRCAGRIEKRRGLGVPRDRQQCAAVLPASVVESEISSWFVSVHVDRAPATTGSTKRLRGTVPVERSLPHQYYVRAMEASLHSIATADPEAMVDIVVYSEGQWGGMVDEMGVPVEWDLPSDVCEELGLHCTQTVVLLNEENSPSVAESLECIAASDVLVASESKFSRAAAVLSNHVKVLTDRWEMDDDELMVVLNPATTIAGMPASQRQLLRSHISDYHECNPSSA